MENYRDVVDDIIICYKNISCNMFLKLHFLHSHLDFFSENLGALSDEQKNHFNPKISAMENWHQGK